MLFPYATDAPVDHGPWGTIAMIAANVAVTVGAMWALVTGSVTDAEAPQWLAWWVLAHGAGLQPMQWITSNFYHADLSHLLGNMVALWTFGLVVEGKLGWWRFLLVYLGIGAGECALEQVLAGVTGAEGVSFGASAIVFGMMAIALVWAPKNDITFFYWIAFRWWGTFDAPIMTVAPLYIAWQAGLLMLGGQWLSAEWMHLTGALLGAIIGIALLKLDWVDCENWDILAVWGGRLGQPPELSARQTAQQQVAEQKKSSEQDVAARARLRELLVGGNAVGAYSLHRKMLAMRGDWELGYGELATLAQRLHDARAWDACLETARELIRRFPEKAPKVRLMAAQVLLKEKRRPMKAVQVLDQIAEGVLPPPLEATRRKLRLQAEQVVDDAEIEIDDGQAW